MVDQGWTARTSRLVHITEVPTPMRYAVEEHCAGQLMGELAGASACCLTATTEPGGSPGRPTGAVRHRLDVLLGRHLLTAGDGPHRGYARSTRLTAVTLAAPTPYGVLVTARWQAHGRAESCWLGFGDGPDGRTFLLLLRTAVERASRQAPAGAGGRSAPHRTGRFSRVR
ncbi:hypothetical protein O7623_11475 [Solwaraspora sp. WMMD791]|uniref:hypothetical protein n=1 Tax=Solwaraspora sp. WMMD791 TaxID=3016086 RepID=UPI00249A6174|nr:hypothetical protein [Solwaraspora sp. WMMD791]WFE29762.1 hypothetical protein O7623_11475 [Solwaraspora sp. WMMD791]